jgi:glutaredoxin
LIKILSSKSCSQCKIAKSLLGDIEYQEINVNTEEGLQIAKEYNVIHLPFFLINGNPVYETKEVLKIVKG